MKETITRILGRLKKWFILLLLIPFLAAGAAYLFQKEGPASYTTNAEIRLATFNKDSLQVDYTDPESAKVYITSDEFLNQLENKDIDKSKINFVIKPAKVLGISYTSDNGKDAESSLEQIVSRYVLESQKKKDEIKGILEKDISTLGSESEQTAGEIELVILGLKEVKVLKEVQLDQALENTQQSVVFGFLVGLILSLMILLLPEVFRK